MIELDDSVCEYEGEMINGKANGYSVQQLHLIKYGASPSIIY